MRWGSVSDGLYVARPSLPFLAGDEILEQYIILDSTAVGVLSSSFPPLLEREPCVREHQGSTHYKSSKEARDEYEDTKNHLFGAANRDRYSVPAPSWPPDFKRNPAENAAYLKLALNSAALDESALEMFSWIMGWIDSFDPLLQESRELENENVIAANTFYIQAPSFKGALAGTTDTSVNSKVLLGHAGRLVDHPKFSKFFVFQIGVIAHLTYPRHCLRYRFEERGGGDFTGYGAQSRVYLGGGATGGVHLG